MIQECHRANNKLDTNPHKLDPKPTKHRPSIDQTSAKVDEANPTFRNDLEPCGVSLSPWRPHSGPNFQEEKEWYVFGNVKLELYSCFFVGTWRGNNLIQRSVSNASICEPGGMGGLCSTRVQFRLTSRLKSSLDWGWLSSGAAFSSTIMEAAFGRLQNSGGPPKLWNP